MSLTKYSEHFSEDELRCKCGCDYIGMNVEFMEDLEKLREIVAAPIYLNSAYRCPTHNNKVSSTGLNGPHTTRKAVDIRCSAKMAHLVLDAALAAGFSGSGGNQKGVHSTRFIHVDTIESDGRPWVWSY